MQCRQKRREKTHENSALDAGDWPRTGGNAESEGQPQRDDRRGHAAIKVAT